MLTVYKHIFFTTSTQAWKLSMLEANRLEGLMYFFQKTRKVGLIFFFRSWDKFIIRSQYESIVVCLLFKACQNPLDVQVFSVYREILSKALRYQQNEVFHKIDSKERTLLNMTKGKFSPQHTEAQKIEQTISTLMSQLSKYDFN